MPTVIDPSMMNNHSCKPKLADAFLVVLVHKIERTQDCRPATPFMREVTRNRFISFCDLVETREGFLAYFQRL